MIKSIPLTAEQRGQLADDSPWLKMTDEQSELGRTCPKGYLCCFVGEAFVRISEQSFCAMAKDACRRAFREACSLLGATRSDDIADVDFTPIDLASIGFSVTVTHVDGRSATSAARFELPSTTTH